MNINTLREFINDPDLKGSDEVMIRLYQKDQILEYPLEHIIIDDEEPGIVFLTISE